MKKFLLNLKIKKELKEFKNFKKNYNFKPKEIVKKGETLFVDDICLQESSDAEMIGESETFVNAGYKLHGPKSKVISNLFPYKFYFKGHMVSSIESVFQCLKFKDRKIQKLVFEYDGLASNNVKVASDYNWRETRIVYFQGKSIDRNSKDYEDFIDELYISAIQNLLYRNAIFNIGKKYILHAIGETTKDVTLFTREEFERELNCLKDFIISKTKHNV